MGTAATDKNTSSCHYCRITISSLPGTKSLCVKTSSGIEYGNTYAEIGNEALATSYQTYLIWAASSCRGYISLGCLPRFPLAPAKQALNVCKLEFNIGWPTVAALARVWSALHLAKQRVHFFGMETPPSADTAVARNGRGHLF